MLNPLPIVPRNRTGARRGPKPNGFHVGPYRGPMWKPSSTRSGRRSRWTLRIVYLHLRHISCLFDIWSLQKLDPIEESWNPLLGVTFARNKFWCPRPSLWGLRTGTGQRPDTRNRYWRGNWGAKIRSLLWSNNLLSLTDGLSIRPDIAYKSIL